jgi:hypothetical protein
MSMKADGTVLLNTQERISIGQCLNLAVTLCKDRAVDEDGKLNKEMIKEMAKEIFCVKDELEKNFALNSDGTL